MPHPQPPRKQPQQARSRHLVAALIEAATRVFDEHGFEGATMARVAEVAGVAVGSMYQYFPDKRALVTALHERHAEAALRVILEACTPPGKPGLEESVKGVVRGLLQLHRVEPRLQRLLHEEQATLQYRKADSAAGRAIVASTIQWLEAHAEVRHRDLTLTAQVLVRTIEELVHGAVIDPPETANAEEVEQSIVAVAVGYLRQPA